MQLAMMRRYDEELQAPYLEELTINGSKNLKPYTLYPEFGISGFCQVVCTQMLTDITGLAFDRYW